MREVPEKHLSHRTVSMLSFGIQVCDVGGILDSDF